MKKTQEGSVFQLQAHAEIGKKTAMKKVQKIPQNSSLVMPNEIPSEDEAKRQQKGCATREGILHKSAGQQREIDHKYLQMVLNAPRNTSKKKMPRRSNKTLLQANQCRYNHAPKLLQSQHKMLDLSSQSRPLWVKR